MITLTATPKAGHRFVRWIEDNKTLSNSYQYKYTVSKNTTIQAEFASISKPDLFSVISSSYNNISLSWKPVSGAAGYNVYRSESKDGSYKYIGYSTSNNYIDKNLITGKSYYYEIVVFCKAGSVTTYSSYSSYKSAMPVPAQPTGCMQYLQQKKQNCHGILY